MNELGYLRLAGALPSRLLARWRALAGRLEGEAVADFEIGQQPRKAAVVAAADGARAYRIDDVLERDPEAVLELLGCPAMAAIARQCSGPGTVPLSVDIVCRYPHPHPPVPWHQDAGHPRTHPYLNVGIYLDDADAGDGCLRYVPRTQHALLDITRIEEAHGWNPPGMVEVPARAGDILVQDMMVLHGAPPKRTPGPRRTVYVEFRPVEAIRRQGAQSEAWVHLRERWMALVRRRAAPDEPPAFDDLGPVAAEVARIAAAWEAPVPGHYGTLPVRHPDYPIPADLHGSAV